MFRSGVIAWVSGSFLRRWVKLGAMRLTQNHVGEKVAWQGEEIHFAGLKPGDLADLMGDLIAAHQRIGVSGQLRQEQEGQPRDRGPDWRVDLFISFCLQNNGRLSSGKRASHFDFLTEENRVT